MLEKIIKKRRSIRQFDNHSVNTQKVLRLLEIARFAPSGKNRQPWRIKIIEKKKKEMLIKLLMNNSINNKKFPGSLKISLKAIDQCDKIILFFNPYSYQEKDYSHKTMLMDTQSIGALIQNFLLLSTENGISTLWINDIFYAKKEIENFYVDSTMEIVAAVAVGYSSKIRTYNIRKELDEILL